MDEYVSRMERIIKRNLEIYGDLQKRVKTFKKHMQEEEEAHQKDNKELFIILQKLNLLSMAINQNSGEAYKEMKTLFE